MSVEVLPLLSTAERAALVAQANQPARSKYHARRCAIHTPSHASQKECRRFCELEQMEKGGLIRLLRQQERFNLCHKTDGFECNEKHRHVTYVADFVYVEPCRAHKGQEEQCFEVRYVVEDCKGFKTPVYLVKKRLMESMGYTIRET